MCQSAPTADSDLLPGVPVWESRSATEEEVFYKRWAMASLRRNLPFVNDVLRSLVTLNVTLLGGSVVLLDSSRLWPGFQVAVVACFLVSLVAAFFGMLPFTGTVDVFCPEMIRRHKTRALTWKRWLLAAAAIALVAGFAVALIGLIVKVA